ncbi:hypothetical protein FisN_1Hh448 [Fistulifera solaris]|jgi:hypothetical protein|uniref:VPS9 domain-containing protein n=1 Tax=Fistulifera solaris TaxID=1519565 RepID=A0A1Z5JJR9_FISSO|nr:hypothetical protein FisN_1Hh448 [Fistulifera solaris]|eukprot:GAX14253.1 hypothetical protein FisN_1Hh448 [Fistulifera solaris]
MTGNTLTMQSEHHEASSAQAEQCSILSTSSDSASLNELEDVKSDVQGISLLKQIFPEETVDNLKVMHCDILQRTRRTKELHISPPYGKAVNEHAVTQPVSAPHLHSELIERFEEQVFSFLESSSIATNGDRFSAVLVRDPLIGLGMNLLAENSTIYVHSLNRHPIGINIEDSGSPASKAGIKPGDIIVGVNGQSFSSHDAEFDNALQRLASTLLLSSDPVVLHCLRPKAKIKEYDSQHDGAPSSMITQSILDTSDFLEELPSFEISFRSERPFYSTPLNSLSEHSLRHPFIARMVSQKLLPAKNEVKEYRKFMQLNERARLWEMNGSFTFIPKKGKDEEILVPIVGVRKALCVRILNSYENENDTAYTIWIYDVESGREWYAPVRYFKDFQDLRAATSPICNSIASLPFPKGPLSLFRSPIVKERSSDKASKVRQLESFLRALIAMIYKEDIHPGMAEVAHHVQCFLRWDNVVGSLVDVGWHENEGHVDEMDANESHVRLGLKRSIQRYVYRIFLLDTMATTVENFVDGIRSHEPTLEEIELLEAEGKKALKIRAIQELSRVQAFIDHLQDIILLGCMHDFRSISERECYDLLHSKIHESLHGGGFWDKLLREAVREQIEIEVYVPLRSVLSKWLVNGWRHEDIEAHYKMRELSRHSGKYFSMGENTLHHWGPVAKILKEGVGLSSLPCIKLRAIVEAASEINRIFVRLKGCEDERHGHIGADEFLPVFIYCVVKAEMERPCALCVLLRTICDPINRIGETGYYFASFEAAVAHLREIDPFDSQNTTQTSFISVPLDG